MGDLEGDARWGREFWAEGTAGAQARGGRVLGTRSANPGFLWGLADQRDGPWGGPGLAEGAEH